MTAIAAQKYHARVSSNSEFDIRPGSTLCFMRSEMLNKKAAPNAKMARRSGRIRLAATGPLFLARRWLIQFAAKNEPNPNKKQPGMPIKYDMMFSS